MSRENDKKAARLLLAVIILSLLVMGFTTWFYSWKGLDKIKNPDEPAKAYYVTI